MAERGSFGSRGFALSLLNSMAVVGIDFGSLHSKVIIILIHQDNAKND